MERRNANNLETGFRDGEKKTCHDYTMNVGWVANEGVVKGGTGLKVPQIV